MGHATNLPNLYSRTDPADASITERLTGQRSPVVLHIGRRGRDGFERVRTEVWNGRARQTRRTPSLQWVPWPPQLPWPCGSPPSSVLWAHKIPHNPSPAVSGCRPPTTSSRGDYEAFPMENPCGSVPRARDFQTASHDGCPDTAFDRYIGIRNVINFGAESSQPTSSLSTLLSRRSPGDRQDSLPACPLRL